MSHRAHLFSLRIAKALRESLAERHYSRPLFFQDLLAGITVGIIAIPLAMALAIASGVPPQHGLYTAAIAGIVIAVTGGSRFSVSGPTAAYVVILLPIVHQWGLAGLFIAGFMSGVILIALAVMRLGRFIEYIPESVTLGFTGGIAIVIVMLQLKDFFGLPSDGNSPSHLLDKLHRVVTAMPSVDIVNTALALATLLVMFLWPKLRSGIPPHLVAVVVASLAAWIMNHNGGNIDTIASRFQFVGSDGLTHFGIPQGLPALTWPWHWPGSDGQPIELSWSLIRDLLPSAFAIAFLGAIESLLCAVVLDGMSGKRHSANSELLGQGIGNLVMPFVGGISATAAIARSAANFKAGAVTPVAAAIHGVIVLLAMLLLAPLLAHLPMAAMAAMLMVVAWNMSEAHKSVHLVKTSPVSDIVVWASCLLLTVLFDMVIAIATGMLLATVLFVKDIASLTRVQAINSESTPTQWREFAIHGPLFFAAADRVFGELAQLCKQPQGLIIDMSGVTYLDAGGLSALLKLLNQCQSDGTQIGLANTQFQPLKTLAKAKHLPALSYCQYFSDIHAARRTLFGTAQIEG